MGTQDKHELGRRHGQWTPESRREALGAAEQEASEAGGRGAEGWDPQRPARTT